MTIFELNLVLYWLVKMAHLQRGKDKYSYFLDGVSILLPSMLKNQGVDSLIYLLADEFL